MATGKIKITFILPSLVAGGAERIMSFIAQELDAEKFETTLLVVGFEKDSVYSTGKTQTIYLNKHRVLHAISGLFSHFKNMKPDIVVSSIVHLNTLIAILSVMFPKIKFVAREANVLSVLKKYNHHSKIYFPKILTVFGYKLVDRIVCQSQDMKRDMIMNYGVSENKVVFINNPITHNLKPKAKARDYSEPFRFITVARLSKEKGHDRIIKVLSKLKFPFHYTIIGDGIEKDSILDLVNEGELTKRVTHIPYTDNVSKYLRESDLFLQGSYVEGFPNALLESCVAGTPIVAFNAPGGLNEIIEEGINGHIINTVEECVNCLNNLNNSFNFNPESVSQIVNERFNKNKIISKYEALFLNLIKNVK